MIPILDLGPDLRQHEADYVAAFRRVLRSGQFVGGPEVEAFEREVAEALGVAHAVGLNSGTDALVIALRALGVGPGDEVVTTAFTFFATAEAVSQVGARPVFADVDEHTFNLDPDAVEAAVTERTRAVLPVHLYGRVAPMARLAEIARRRGLAVVEDCAQSFGAVYGGDCVDCHGARCDPAVRTELAGRQTGTMGEVGCFSFFPSKNLGAMGDAGLLATDDPDLADAARRLRAHGSRQRYRNESVGYNSRLDAVQAALLRERLPRVAAENAARRAAARRYTTALADVAGVVAPEVRNGDVVHQYTVRVPGRRDAVAQALAAEGVETRVYYPVPCHRLPVYAQAGYPALPVTERLANEVLSLPIGPHLAPETVDRVVAAVARALA